MAGHERAYDIIGSTHRVLWRASAGECARAVDRVRGTGRAGGIGRDGRARGDGHDGARRSKGRRCCGVAVYDMDVVVVVVRVQRVVVLVVVRLRHMRVFRVWRGLRARPLLIGLQQRRKGHARRRGHGGSLEPNPRLPIYPIVWRARSLGPAIPHQTAFVASLSLAVAIRSRVTIHPIT